MADNRRRLKKKEREFQMKTIHSLVKMGYKIADVAPRFGSTPANLRASYKRYLIKLKKEESK